ncbi:hypothetical protein ANN_11468 [Periplaneta americana]|uniref:DUF4817 domain-containing protein n=1 Tax=Periplaneta americana TaxID=6978 RepID=A0ABQ8T547_PERAM|nr:hypothetical protein ANN_11468 [Periplaneta americana]
MLQLCWEYDKEIARIHNDFSTSFPDVPLPTRQHLRKLDLKFERTGNIRHASRSGRPRAVRSKENAQLVTLAFVASPHKSTRKVFSVLRSNSDELKMSIENAFYIINEDKPSLSRICESVVKSSHEMC